jgi:hypothetical protein
VVVGTDACLVAKVNICSRLLGQFLDCLEIFGHPVNHKNLVLLQCPADRPLGAQAKLVEQTTHGDIAQANIEFPPDQLPNHSPCPQGKLKFQLPMILANHKPINLLQVLPGSNGSHCTVGGKYKNWLSVLIGRDLLDNLPDLIRRRNDLDYVHTGGDLAREIMDGGGGDAEAIDRVEHVGGFFAGVLGNQEGSDLLDIVLIFSRSEIEDILIWRMMRFAFRAKQIGTISKI